ncbi:hypothetical protein BKA93DRAFT_824690 [Sparassis latifolia]
MDGPRYAPQSVFLEGGVPRYLSVSGRPLSIAEMSHRFKRRGMVFPSDVVIPELESIPSSSSSSSTDKGHNVVELFPPPGPRSILRIMAPRTREGPTPAQDFAAQYRATHTAWEYEPSEVGSSTYVGSAMMSVDALSAGPDTASQVRFSQLDEDAMEGFSSEAVEMASAGVGARNIRCRRPGCHYVLEDVRALTAHLHLHSIGHERNGIEGFNGPSATANKPSGNRRRNLPHSAPKGVHIL